MIVKDVHTKRRKKNRRKNIATTKAASTIQPDNNISLYS